MTKYFTKCKTAEDVKVRFKELAKQLHPDCGGNEEDFKGMMSEYTDVFNRLKDIHTSAKGEMYESKTPSTETPESFANIINELIFMKGVKVELIGSWIWVSGSTKPYKEKLKDLKFRWSKAKAAWYYTTSPKRRPRRNNTLDDLRNRWGATEIVFAPQREIESATEMRRLPA